MSHNHSHAHPAIDAITSMIRSIALKLLNVAQVQDAETVLATYNLIPGWAPKGARTRVKGQTAMKQPFWLESAANGAGGAKYLSMVSFDTLATGHAPSIVSTIAHLLSVAEAAIENPKKPGTLSFYPRGWGQIAKRYGLTGEAKDKYALSQTPEALLHDDGIGEECNLLAGLVAEAVGKAPKTIETFKFTLTIEGEEEPFTMRQSAKAGARLVAALAKGGKVSIQRDETPEAPENGVSEPNIDDAPLPAAVNA